MKWGGREWLKFGEAEGMMFCSWCCLFDRNGHRNLFVLGCSTMKVVSVKKHEQSQQHKDAESSYQNPERAQMEVAVQHMAHEELEQITQNGLSIGSADGNEKQAKTFISFIADEIGSKLVSLLHDGVFLAYHLIAALITVT